MNAKTHWEKVYATKAPEAVSWYRPHLETSLARIERAAVGFSASVIDVGGGESTLVDDLLARGYENVTVPDVSQTALEVTKKRLGLAVEQVHWLVADVTDSQLEHHAYDMWHDRAVFHFLTAIEQRVRIVSGSSWISQSSRPQIQACPERTLGVRQFDDGHSFPSDFAIA
jgi:2-polyprenyl-3-methyl-5-hydroxy-6-metoxy-1,4-benzoquinol methylase